METARDRQIEGTRRERNDKREAEMEMQSYVYMCIYVQRKRDKKKTIKMEREGSWRKTLWQWNPPLSRW